MKSCILFAFVVYHPHMLVSTNLNSASRSLPVVLTLHTSATSFACAVEIEVRYRLSFTQAPSCLRDLPRVCTRATHYILEYQLQTFGLWWRLVAGKWNWTQIALTTGCFIWLLSHLE